MINGASNPGFAALQPYPFEKLARLLNGVTPADKPAISLSIGEPRHAPPVHVLDVYRKHLLDGVSRYPTIRGSDSLRTSCSNWLQRRFGVTLDPDTMVQPVTGTREALFAFAQAFINPSAGQKVLIPNPFYQIYEGAALMAGAEVVYLNVFRENDYLPDLDVIDAAVLDATRIFYLCSPVNPCGTIASLDYLIRLLRLAERHDFIIAADECYIELYRDAPPVSLLNACEAAGSSEFRRVVAFHSLSKRSNLPGLRSGFVAGDPDLIGDFVRYRNYHGCSMSLAVQAASIAAWDDDAHVKDNRALYNAKFAAAMPYLSDLPQVDLPPAAFYLWPEVGEDDERFCRDLFAEENIVAVPGSYLSREVDGLNPGRGFVRLSLVASAEDTLEAMQRLQRFIRTRNPKS